jgi:hypothetical protein
VVIDASHGGNKWRERKPVTEEFYYPQGHPQAGQAFKFQDNICPPS